MGCRVWPRLFAFFFENAHFAQLQQEYGILEMASWFRGTPYAEAELLTFAATQLGRSVDDVALKGLRCRSRPGCIRSGRSSSACRS